MKRTTAGEVWTRAIAVLALAGIAAIGLSLFPTWARTDAETYVVSSQAMADATGYHVSTDQDHVTTVRLSASDLRLADDAPWPHLWALTLAVLALVAAALLLFPLGPAASPPAPDAGPVSPSIGRAESKRRPSGRAVGLAVIIGMTPVLVSTALGHAAFVVRPDVGIRSGFVLLALGCVLVVVAACLAVMQFGNIELSWPRTWRTAWPSIVAVGIGAVTSISVSVRQLTPLAVWSLIISLTLVTRPPRS